MEQAFAKYIEQLETVGESYELRKRFRYEEELTESATEIVGIDSSMWPKRSSGSWLKTVIYYSILYCGILILWQALFSVFRMMLSEEVPTYLAWQPGFCYAPHINESYNSIDYNVNDATQVNALVDGIKQFLQKFGNRTDFGSCTAATNYGYDKHIPCIFLKINRVIGFHTKPFENLTDIPESVPNLLRAHISQQDETNRKGRVWISCKASDREVLFTYFPAEQAVLTKYIDTPKRIQHQQTDDENARFYNDDDYKRVVAVQLSNITLNVAMEVWCYMWARNIKIGKPSETGRGFVRLSLRVIE